MKTSVILAAAFMLSSASSPAYADTTSVPPGNPCAGSTGNLCNGNNGNLGQQGNANH